MPAKRNDKSSDPAPSNNNPHKRTDGPGRPVGNRKEYFADKVEYPSGKSRKLRNGTSAWQKLIEDQRVALNKSLRAVANATGGEISFNGLWQWLRLDTGFPAPRNYTAAKNAALARALDLDPDTLASAYEEAKMAFGLRSAKSTARETTKFALLRKLIQEGKATWTRSDLLDLIDGLTA